MTKKFNKKILDFIVCPRTKSKLSYDSKKNILISENKKYTYPVKNGVPILLVDDELSEL